MKFTDGTWFVKKGVQIYSPNKPFEIIKHEHSLTVIAPATKVDKREQALGGPVLQIAFSSPANDVIKVNITHFKGRKRKLPKYDISCMETVDTDVLEDEEKVTFCSGRLSVDISKINGWETKFYYDDQYLTGNQLVEKEGGSISRGYIVDAIDQSYICEELHLSVGEHIYGFGERFSAFVKNGQSIEMWNYEAGTSSNLSYKNIPFYVSDQKYGIFVNSPGNVSFEVASEKVSKVQFSVKGETIEYFIIGGSSLKDVINKYTLMMGRPAIPPPWSFGLWLSTSFSPEYTEETVLAMIEQMAQLDIPLQVIHFDCFWMKPYHWCDFEWDLQSFPNAKGMIEKIKRRGLKVSLWINPYISQFSELFEEGRESRYFIMHQNGDVWQSDIWQPGMAFVDFTNPDACKWYSSKLEKLIDDGIDSFKTDFGEMIPTTDVQFFDGSESESMHNFYSFLYNKTVFDLLERKLGKGEAVVFSRSATAGGQKYPVHWGGDSYCTYESMAESLRGGLSLGLSGYAFWSHDIGGFGGFSAKPEPDLYKRWFPFGLLSSHSRLHGNTTLRVPWLFGEEAVAVARFFTKLKCRLMPYLYWYAHQAHHEGIPLLRAMILEFEDDPTCKTLDCQYMLGESLLIAPVFNKQGEVTYYVPNGMWTKLLTGEKVIGGRWYREVYDFLSLPILVRPDSIIPIGNNSSSTEYDFADEVTLHVYNLNENVWHEVFVVCREGEDELMIRLNLLEGEFTIEPIKANKQWYIMLHNVSSLHSADNATYNSKDNGCYIIPTDFSRRVIIKVAEDYQY